MTDEIPEWAREKARAVMSAMPARKAGVSSREWETIEAFISNAIVMAYNSGRDSGAGNKAVPELRGIFEVELSAAIYAANMRGRIEAWGTKPQGD